MKTVCLSVNVSSAKTNILYDDAITTKVMFSVLQKRDTRLFTQQNVIAITAFFYA